MQEAGGQGAGPAAQVEGADQAVSDAHVSAAYLHLDRRLLVVLGGRASQGGGHQEHAKLAPSQVVDGQPGPRQQAAQVVDACGLAHGVEAPVEDAVAGLQVGQETPKRLGGGPRLRGQVLRLGLLEVLPQPSQAGRVLPDEQLRREVQGVERPGEGSQLRLVQLQAHHLAHAELHPVQADRPVVVQVRQHEEQGQLGRELGERDRCLGVLRIGRKPLFRRLVRSVGRLRRPNLSSSQQLSNKLFQRSGLLCSMGLGSPRGRC